MILKRGLSMEEISGTDKEYILNLTSKFLKEERYLVRERASAQIDLDRSWTIKALIKGIILYADMQGALFCEESTAIGCQGDLVYLIKPNINEFWRWVVFKFGVDEYGDAVLVIIISAHKDEKIYGKTGDLSKEGGELDECKYED